MKINQMKTMDLRDHLHQFCRIGPCKKVVERLKKKFDAGHLAIQTSVTSNALQKISSPLQIPECHANPRLPLIADTHDESEGLYDHVLKVLLTEVNTNDSQTKLCSVMLATTVVVSLHSSGMLQHETMDNITLTLMYLITSECI